MKEALEEYYEQLSKSEIINLMYAALDEMQSFNGRSQTECIVRAAGGSIEELPSGRMRYSMPPIAVAKANLSKRHF